jgi:protein archease
MPYRFIDHTADVAADLTGATLDELFTSAAQALTETMTDIEQVGTELTDQVGLQAQTPEDLLVDWVNELLYRFEVRNLLVREADVRVTHEDDRWLLSAALRGQRFDAQRHAIRVLVKSATYHGLSVTQTNTGWSARLVLDI